MRFQTWTNTFSDFDFSGDEYDQQGFEFEFSGDLIFGNAFAPVDFNIGAAFNFDTFVQQSSGSVGNTIPGNTSTTETIEVGSQRIETLDFDGDQDWFKVTLEAGKTYDISSLGTGDNPLKDPLVRLMDANGVELATNDDIINGDVRHSLLTFTATDAGTYYISAQAYSTETGIYTLSINQAADSDIAGDATTTSVAVVNGSVSGEIETASDTDWFAITLEAGHRYIISQNGVGTGKLSDSFVRLFDANGVEVGSNDDAGPELNARMAYVVETGGTYYISAESAANTTGTYGISVQDVPNLVERNVDDVAHFLTDEFDTREAYNTTNITYNVTGLSEGAQALAIRALQAWSDVTPLIFTAVTTGGNIVFQDTGDGAYNSNQSVAGIIGSGTVNVNSGWNGGNLNVDSYTYQTFLHEIGHALGLGHAGAYNGNATYNIDNSYLNDSWAYTVMSYFDQAESGYFGDFRYVLGPQIADIIAVQDLYGVNTTTRLGDTVYGFNSTETDVHDFSQFTRAPSLSIWDAGGIDTLDFSKYEQDQVINLTQESFSNVNGISHAITIARGTIIENAIGGFGADTITGNDESNVLTGNAGNDILDGGAGTDYAAYSGTSINEYTITENTDGSFTVAHNNSGVDGTDTLKNIEYLRINGVDHVLGQAVVNLTEGDDTHVGTNNADTIAALGGNDNVRGLGGNDRLYGGDGDDRLQGGDGNDLLNGDAGIDVLFGEAGNDTINGGAGNDRMYGHAGADVLNGNDGNDDLYGGDGDDTLYGGANDDFLAGQSGTDTLYGGIGNDRMLGGSGDDVLYGEAGDDVLLGEAGTDTLHGGAGNDRLNGYGDADILNGDAGNDELYGGFGNDTLNGGSGVDLIAGQYGNNTLNGGDGNDRMFGGGGDDAINGDAGNDVIFAAGGVDIVSGGAGDDRMYGHSGNDIINGDAGNDEIYGGNDNDTIYGGADVDLVVGQFGDDTLYGGSGNDRVFGGSGADFVYGDAGDDALFGDAGNDTIAGGTGDDRMYGGSGDDNFRYNTGTDRADIILDFQAGAASGDTITLEGGNAAFDTFAEVIATAIQRGANTVLRFGGGNTLTLQGVTIADLNADDFDFGASVAEAPDAKHTVLEVLNDVVVQDQDLVAEFLKVVPVYAESFEYVDAEGYLAMSPDVDGLWDIG